MITVKQNERELNGIVETIFYEMSKCNVEICQNRQNGQMVIDSVKSTIKKECARYAFIIFNEEKDRKVALDKLTDREKELLGLKEK